jgi:hypothetical protein
VWASSQGVRERESEPNYTQEYLRGASRSPKIAGCCSGARFVCVHHPRTRAAQLDRDGWMMMKEMREGFDVHRASTKQLGGSGGCPIAKFLMRGNRDD